VGRNAIIIAVSYGILGGLVVVVLAALVWSSTLGGRRQIDARKLREREKTWFGIVVVLLVGLLFATIFSNSVRVRFTSSSFSMPC